MCAKELEKMVHNHPCETGSTISEKSVGYSVLLNYLLVKKLDRIRCSWCTKGSRFIPFREMAHRDL